MAAAALLAQQRLIDFIPGQRERVRRQTFTPGLNLSAAPVHGAPSSRALAVAHVTEIAQILDRRRGLKLARVSELLLDIPASTTIRGRITERALERRHRPVNGALTPTRNAGESGLGGRAKSGAIRR
jgi:hypothetical protein